MLSHQRPTCQRTGHRRRGKSRFPFHALGLFVKTGSRDEAVKINGVSHFLEHMMFKGSSKYTWEDVNRIFDEIGAKYNAFTSQEMTAYYANVLPEFTERRWSISRTCSALPSASMISRPKRK